MPRRPPAPTCRKTSKDEFDAFLDYGIPARGFLRLRCADRGHDKLVAFSCKRRGFCPPYGARCMAQTAAHLVEHVIPHVPVRQWVRVCQVRLRILLRLLLASQPELVTPGTLQDESIRVAVTTQLRPVASTACRSH